jgi:hypothetical protein
MKLVLFIDLTYRPDSKNTENDDDDEDDDGDEESDPNTLVET